MIACIHLILDPGANIFNLQTILCNEEVQFSVKEKITVYINCVQLKKLIFVYNYKKLASNQCALITALCNNSYL
jgi:hypothetical protein